MGAATTIAGLGIIGATAAGIFFFREGIKNAFASPEQKTAEAEQTDAVTDLIKGAGDFGKKVTDTIFPTEKPNSGKSTDGKALATDEQKKALGFDDSALVVVDNSTGVIEANTSPRFTLTEEEKAKIRGLSNFQKISTRPRGVFNR